MSLSHLRPVLAGAFLAGLFLAQAGCECPVEHPPEVDGTYDPETTLVEGLVEDEGFGSSLAVLGDATWVGAPHAGGGRVYAIEEAVPVEVVAGEGRLGSALAPFADAFVAGAPLAQDGAGALVGSDGAVLASGGGSTGLAVAGGEEWVVAESTGWLASDGSTGATPGRPTALALAAGEVGVGMAHGAVAFQAGAFAWSRPESADEAGFAVAAGDVDHDGDVEWLVGAPAVALVYVLDPEALAVETALAGEGGRFGAALAVADIDGDGIDDLVVGAPTAGDRVEGAAYVYLGGQLDQPAASFVGKRRSDQLGFAVAAAPGRVVLGIPGGPARPGLVQIVTAEQL